MELGKDCHFKLKLVNRLKLKTKQFLRLAPIRLTFVRLRCR